MYKITKGQLLTIWVFGVMLCMYMADQAGVVAVSILAVLIFYHIGWNNYQKKNKDKTDG